MHSWRGEKRTGNSFNSALNCPNYPGHLNRDRRPSSNLASHATMQTVLPKMCKLVRNNRIEVGLSTMTERELDQFICHHPCLYHLAEPGGWVGVQLNGFLSASALLDLYHVRGKKRYALESARRPATTKLTRRGLPDAFVRDQRPMNDSTLRDCLPSDISPRQWYEFLNSKVFFWLSRDRLVRMSRAYVDAAREVIILDTRAIIDAYRGRISLSHMNSGCSIPWKHRRSFETFRPIADYPLAKRRQTAAELCVDDAVPDAARFVQSVIEIRGGTWGKTLFPA